VTGRIRRLPDHLVNKIAAGEVVERPSSVVKELVENALDADARTVTVDLRDGGAALTRVSDDGWGMTPPELELALERHATSKLGRDEDLEAIATLGFRGEALPAICAVSRFTIVSRAREAAEGWRVSGAGGRLSQRLAVPAEAGTMVEVSDLFFNTPARLKFLKSATTELSACLRHLTALALAQPQVHVRAAHNGRGVLAAPAARDLRARVGGLWGWETAERLLDVSRAEQGVGVRGVTGPPDLTRGGRDDVIIVVNGRPVRDPALFQAVLEAYRPLLPRDRFPLAVLAITLPPTDVDVNVHPTKAWVRFRHPRLVQETVMAALGEALRGRAVVPAVDLAPSRAAGAGGLEPALATGEAGQGALFAEAPGAYLTSGFGRLLGQVQDTFVVAATEREVFFIDQHAAHERVVVERLERELAAGAPAAQTLLFPAPLALAPAARLSLERCREPLERLGFAFEGFGGDTVVLRAVPTALAGDEPRQLIEAAVDELGRAKPGEPVLDRVLAFVACRAAIKAPRPLEREEMERLVSELAQTATPYFCPHGRPTMSRISLGDVRREVRRLW
jgi:DNA mismatch repair protein MutL